MYSLKKKKKAGQDNQLHVAVDLLNKSVQGCFYAYNIVLSNHFKNMYNPPYLSHYRVLNIFELFNCFFLYPTLNQVSCGC